MTQKKTPESTPATPLDVAEVVAQRWQASTEHIRGTGELATLCLASDVGEVTIAPAHGDEAVYDGHVLLVLGHGRRTNRYALFRDHDTVTVQKETDASTLPFVDQAGLNYLYRVVRQGRPKTERPRRLLAMLSLGRGPQG